MAELDPLVSQDGRFKWDGKHWVATPLQTRRTVGMVLAIMAALIGILLVPFAFVLAPVIVEMFKLFT